MKVVETATALKAAWAGWERPVGFVPTMGYLHAGHLALIASARAECRTVVVSIFVNPAQFGPGEDLTRYPRDIPRDLRLCEEAGVDLVVTPSSREIYPEGYRTYVEVNELQDRWEGATRPEHFRGVATVVTVLLRIVAPDRAYFGEKDYQQLQIIGQLNRDLHLDVEIVGCPTIREADGLACSSRNGYLSGEDRKRAGALYRALCAAQTQLAGGERHSAVLLDTMRETLESTPGVEVDYVAVVDPATLVPLPRVETEARALVAVRIAGVHLIDNAPLIPPVA